MCVYVCVTVDAIKSLPSVVNNTPVQEDELKESPRLLFYGGWYLGALAFAAYLLNVVEPRHAEEHPHYNVGDTILIHIISV